LRDRYKARAPILSKANAPGAGTGLVGPVVNAYAFDDNNKIFIPAIIDNNLFITNSLN